jgi:hypothetical protein
LFPYRLLRFLSNYLRSLISTLKSKISKIKLLVVRCSNSMHYVVLLMITKTKICTKSAVDHHKLTEGIIFTMQFPAATVKKIKDQPESVEELRARKTREEIFKIAWDIV